MDEGRISKLLEEIRDLQSEHLALYRTALETQQESVRSQREAIAFQRIMMKRLSLIILPVLAFVIGLVIWLVLQL